MRKLKFDFKTAKKFIVTALASTMITTFVAGCTRIDNNQIDPNTYNSQEVTQTVDMPDEEITIEEIIENAEETVEKGNSEKIQHNAKEEKKYIDKIIIQSEEDLEEALQYDSIGYLKIMNANISDFSFLNNIDVELLQVINNDSPINMENINENSIKQMYFHNVDLENTQKIANFKNLENFVLKSNKNNNSITNLDFLKKCSNLTNIEVQNYAIENLSFVKEMKELKSLSIINSAIEDISAIKNCKKIGSLTLKRSKISDISALKELDNLQALDLSDNYITDISSINSQVLTYLNLEENFIKDATTLRRCEMLRSVNLSKNYISEFPIELMKDESTIDLSYNNITQLTAEEKNIIQNTNISLNMFDNMLSPETVREIGEYNSVYFEASKDSILTTNQAVNYTKKMHEIVSEFGKGEKIERIMGLNKYIAYNCDFDYELSNENKDNAYGALFEKSVCTGYTDLVHSLCIHSGIEVKQVHGDFQDPSDNQRHVWNMCNIDGNYYHWDAMHSKVLLSDSQIKENGHIIDAMNVHECDSEISEQDRGKIMEIINKYDINFEEDNR